MLILGAGIAGLSFALSLPFPARITIVTKGALGESNTRYAQGGLAAAIGDTDDPELHLIDTIVAGAGMVDIEAARRMTEAGPEAVDWLVRHGAAFDRDGTSFALGKEGAHSRSRVLHAGGDATGAEIERALVASIAERRDVTVLEHTSACHLHVVGGRCVGADLIVNGEHLRTVSSAVTVLAMGGAGRLWAVSSNPSGATGDGVVLALRAGAELADLEFTQFHPTVLDMPGTEPFLISEAVRGDGAWLRNDAGERFMVDIDPRAELASRDVVSRAIQTQITGGSRVWLDLRHLDRDVVLARFPTIARHLRAAGLSLATDLIPVAPAAHYFMGGVAATPGGRTSVPGLLAIGEVSCTGVHGANRLASNSLLEGLVFGRLAARSLQECDLAIPTSNAPSPRRSMHLSADPVLDGLKRNVQGIMRDHVSVVRNARSLTTAIDELGSLLTHPALQDQLSLPAVAVRDMAMVAQEISRSALEREESRGGHFRSDFPSRNPEFDNCHQLVRRSESGQVKRAFGALKVSSAQ